MAWRRVELGEKIRIRHGIHRGKVGKVVAHEHRPDRRPGRNTLLTYVVELSDRRIRVPGSHLDLWLGSG